MKKLFVTLAVASLAASSFAQGTVNWTGVAGLFVGKTNATAYSTFVSDSGGNLGGTTGNTAANTSAANTALGYSGYYYALLVSTTASAAPTSVANLSSWTFTGLMATNGPAANGRIVQVAPTSGTATGDAATGWTAGTQANVVLVGWSANLGTSYATVLNELSNWGTAQNSITGAAFFGSSLMGTLVSGTADPGVVIFGTTAGQINNGSASPFNMYQLGVTPTPEPATMVLAGLGGLSLLAFRRKK